MKDNEKTKKQLLEELKKIRKTKVCGELIDKISDVFFAFDKDLKCTYWNQAALKLVGVKEKEVLGKSILDIFPKNEQTQKAIDVYKNVLKTKKLRTFINEYQIKRKVFFFEISVYPFQTGLLVVARDITERRKAEETIIRSEKELGAMYKNVPVLLVLVDEERRVVRANEAALDFAQRTMKEIMGIRGGEALGCLNSLDDPNGCGFGPNCTICGVRNTVLDTFKTGKSHYQAEAALPFEINGKKTILNLIVNTVPIEIDRKRMVLVSIDNITKLKEAEDEIKNLNEIQKTLIENIPVLEYNVGTDEKILDCNKLTLETLGYSDKKQLIGKPLITTIYPQSSQEKAKKLFLKWKKQGWLKNEEIKIVTKKGKILDVLLNVNTLYDTNGKVLSTIYTQLDITDRKKAEEDLKKAYDELDRIFNTSGDGMRVIDKDYNVLKVNKQFCKLSKLNQEENLKKKCYEAFPGPNCHKPTCSLKQVLSGIDYIEREVTKKREDNKEILVIVSCNPLKNADGEIIGIVTNYKDITERKKAEVKLKTSYTQLQKTLNDIINTLASIVETRDPYTSGHQKRVALLAIAIAKELGLDKDKIDALSTAALIHDIGKINIPPSILARPGKISDLEYSMVKTHPQVGYDMIKSIKFPWPIADIILQHHERLDGSGYPKGLKEKDIVLEAKILAVADVVEAMASHRPYRPSLGMNKAIEEITKNRGLLYDPKIVDICRKVLFEKKFMFK